MQNLAIDIETYSSVDLKKSGVYKYVDAPDFKVLLFAYCFNDNPVEIIDLEQGEEIPLNVLYFLKDEDTLKTAFNANFEHVCLSKFLNTELPINQWECTMTKAAILGLPMSLDAVAKALKLGEKKDAVGKTLIRYFSLPCKPTKANNFRNRNLPEHNIDKWNEFKIYCIQDVVVEQTIRKNIEFFEIPTKEKQLWYLDQQINNYGILLQPQFIENAIEIDFNNREYLTKEAIELTGLNNPNSAAQLKEWLSKETNETVTSLTKEAVPLLLKNTDSEVVKKVLGIRQEMSKTSVKKYQSMSNVIGADERARGLLQYYGANRTGRWAGRLVQVQNLPQNHLSDLDLARNIVLDNDAELLTMLYRSVPDTLSQLIRTAFIPSANHRFIVADFSAIEARVIAWLANEKWRMDVFRTHGKIYEASAAQMFKVPIESVTKGSSLRQKGKVSELALGYQGGVNALIKMGALKMGLKEEELPKLVAMWRNANKAIVKLWSDVETMAIEAVDTGETRYMQHNISAKVRNNILFIKLPSKRELCYYNPKLIEGKFGNMSLVYDGMNQTTKTWGRQDTYGGKLVENIIQAIARDCLAEKLLQFGKSQIYKIAMHVHDEVVLDVHKTMGSTEDVNRIMSEAIDWAVGLPLTADSYETDYYKKD